MPRPTIGRTRHPSFRESAARLSELDSAPASQTVDSHPRRRPSRRSRAGEHGIRPVERERLRAEVRDDRPAARARGTTARRRGRCRATRAPRLDCSRCRSASARRYSVSVEAGSPSCASTASCAEPRRLRQVRAVGAEAERRAVARPRQRHAASVPARRRRRGCGRTSGPAGRRRRVRRPRAGRAPRPGRGRPSPGSASMNSVAARARRESALHGRARAACRPTSSHSLPCLRAGRPSASRSRCGRP